MTSENYRQLLNEERDSLEMTKEDFDNTLMHFAMLYHKEQLALSGVSSSLSLSELEEVYYEVGEDWNLWDEKKDGKYPVKRIFNPIKKLIERHKSKQ